MNIIYVYYLGTTYGMRDSLFVVRDSLFVVRDSLFVVRDASYELKITNYELLFSVFGSRVTIHELRVTLKHAHHHRCNSFAIVIGEVGARRQTQTVFKQVFGHGTSIIRVVCENRLQMHRFP
jgi:hypothetical protein